MFVIFYRDLLFQDTGQDIMRIALHDNLRMLNLSNLYLMMLKLFVKKPHVPSEMPAFTLLIYQNIRHIDLHQN